MSSPDNGGSVSSSSGGQSNTASSGAIVVGDKSNPIIKQNAFPIDLAPKIALVKPTDGKGGTVQAHQFRTLTQQPMRVVMPSGAVQTTGTAQIIQTHLMPQAMIKQVDALGRTQITALPSRSMAQSSITVTRPLTPNTFMPRGVTTVTNISGARGTIRAQTPPISTVTNITTGFVRGGTIPPRTPSPAGTVIPSGTTWMAGNQSVQLIRATATTAPETKHFVFPLTETKRFVSVQEKTKRFVSPAVTTETQTYMPAATTLSANIVSSQSGGMPSQVSQPGITLATVLPPRQQTATLVYSSSQQQFGTTAGGQRLAVSNPISAQRQVRPLGVQIGGARLPASGLGVRVSHVHQQRQHGNNNIPVLAPSSVLTSLPAGTSTTGTTSNLTAVTGLPNARIIQVQQQNPGGAAQVLSTGRITGNLMTLHPLVMNASAASASTVRGTVTTAKPSLTITHVGNERSMTGQLTVNHQRTVNERSNNGQPTVTSSTAAHSHQQQPQQQPHQIAQIVNLNQPSINVGHGHQIRATNSSVNALPSVTYTAAQPQQQLVTYRTERTDNASGAINWPPIAKVLPQQQSQQQHSNEPPPIVSVSTVSNAQVTNSSGFEQSFQGRYAPQAGPFAVVPASNRGVVTTSSSSVQSVPVRFNPPLIVDGNTHTVSKQQQQQQQQAPQPQQQQSAKQTHIKPTSIIATPRAQQTIVTAPPRKHGEPYVGAVNAATSSALTKSAVKNLNPTLIAMGSESMVGAQSQRVNSPPISRPGSSDGSTTVSATSSPGIDQQEHEEMNALSAMHRNNRNIGDGAQFKNVDNLFATGPTVNVPQMQANTNALAFGQAAAHKEGICSNLLDTARMCSSLPVATPTAVPATPTSTPTASIPAKSNGNLEELTPRKRARKQQLGDYQKRQTLNYQVSGSGTLTADSSTGGGSFDSDGNTFGGNVSNASSATVGHAIANKNTDASMKNVDFIIKKPRTCTLLDGYKQTWKAANNHFQRYSDVKPREERRPTVVDLANQSHVLQKVNGWKIYHLSSQMEDLTELESQVYDKLASMLQCMEAHNQSSDVDRVNDLIKGNMQRTKIVSDSINEARAQILKVFDHKSHVSDIIHRCASKRNFKKREKS